MIEWLKNLFRDKPRQISIEDYFKIENVPQYMYEDYYTEPTKTKEMK